jgi:type II secretory pathway component PulJ
MSDNNKIAAFTLSELIVVILITVIIIGLAFSTLNLVQTHMRSIESNFNKSMQRQLLEQRLTIDMHRAQMSFIEPQQNMLKLQNEMGITTYGFSENSVITSTDTLDINIQKINYFYLGDTAIDRKIDAVKIFTDTINDKFIFIAKPNDAHFLMLE